MKWSYSSVPMIAVRGMRTSTSRRPATSWKQSMRVCRKAMPRPLPPRKPSPSRMTKASSASTDSSKGTTFPRVRLLCTWLQMSTRCRRRSSNLMKSLTWTGRSRLAIWISPRAMSQLEKWLRSAW